MHLFIQPYASKFTHRQKESQPRHILVAAEQVVHGDERLKLSVIDLGDVTSLQVQLPPSGDEDLQEPLRVGLVTTAVDVWVVAEILHHLAELELPPMPISRRESYRDPATGLPQSAVHHQHELLPLLLGPWGKELTFRIGDCWRGQETVTFATKSCAGGVVSRPSSPSPLMVQAACGGGKESVG